MANTFFQVDKQNCFSFTKSTFTRCCSSHTVWTLGVITSPLNCKQPGVHLTSKLGMKNSSKHRVQKLHFTFHDYCMHTNCCLVCVHAQFKQIFQAGRFLCIFATEADLKQKGKGKEEPQFPSTKYLNRLPNTERKSQGTLQPWQVPSGQRCRTPYLC